MSKVCNKPMGIMRSVCMKPLGHAGPCGWPVLDPSLSSADNLSVGRRATGEDHEQAGPPNEAGD